jgi:formylglycine-generating enzyme required for sulfatase activity
MAFSAHSYASPRGIEVAGVKTDAGQKIDLYDNSYALVVGVAGYDKWPVLEQVPSEIDKVSRILRKHGFTVEEVVNPDDKEMEDSFESFIDNYGYNKKNRLLFFYAGHGYTMDDGKSGYLVPKNAPDPRKDRIGFLRNALDMNQILAWCRKMRAKHALFLFDSCFSGTIFKQRALPDTPPAISRLASKPVRQFITAGTAGEQVPASSTFTPAFVDALEYGLGDLNNDGYISGTELGLYLQDKVPRHVRQTPQYGKITDYGLSRGDYIFLAGGSAYYPESETSSSQSEPKTALKVKSSPSGARVLINGSRQGGTTPLKVSDPGTGEITVAVKKDGYESGKKRLRLEKGRTASVMFFLEKKELTGRLFVNARPRDSRIRIMNITPKYRRGIELEPGDYDVLVTHDGYESLKRNVPVSSGEDVHVDFRLDPLPEKEKASDSASALSSGSDDPSAGDTWTEPVTGMEFVWVPGGCYQMGCGSWTDNCDGDEKPVHGVCLDGFWMGRYEVTINQYRKFLQATGYSDGVDWDDDDCPLNRGGSYSLSGNKFGKNGDQPMIEVSWHGAKAFADWLSRKSGREIRLPTEAEWEYAARSGGKKEKYAGGDDVDSVAWYRGNSGGHTHEVGTKSPNGLGIYDMSGNVWEWVEDKYHDSYQGAPTDGSAWVSGSDSRWVNRGGSWYYIPGIVRAANRSRNDPGNMSRYLGFRLCLPQSGK